MNAHGAWGFLLQEGERLQDRRWEKVGRGRCCSLWLVISVLNLTSRNHHIGTEPQAQRASGRRQRKRIKDPPLITVCYGERHRDSWNLSKAGLS